MEDSHALLIRMRQLEGAMRNAEKELSTVRFDYERARERYFYMLGKEARA